MKVDWKRQKEHFQPDGSLRDIYVLETTLRDWANVLELLRRSPFQAELTRDRVPIGFPDDIGELFANPDRTNALLLFHVAGVELACHFFTHDEIEFDFWPNEVGEPELRALLDFMTELGDLTGKVVVMTPENGPDVPFFRYEPGR